MKLKALLTLYLLSKALLLVTLLARLEGGRIANGTARVRCRELRQREQSARRG